MKKDRPFTHPYIPNSAPETRRKMLAEVGADSMEDFYVDIPQPLRVDDKLNLPQPFLSEYELKKHVDSLLSENTTVNEFTSFLGAGCYQHHVPSICDEINQRAEFLTAYAGEPYDDHGRFQSLFEYTSLMGELLNMDVVNVPTYDGYQASATAIRMASRITGRDEVLICRNIHPGKLSKILDYNQHELQFKQLDFKESDGQFDTVKLQGLLSNKTAAIYFENPAYLGMIETQGDQISSLAHQFGALIIVSANPITLGVLKPPADYGADIVCGDIQPLGMHMQFGGGQAGYIATRDEEQFVMEYPSRLFGIAPTTVKGEYGFGDVAYERTSFAIREKGKEWVGTAAALWGITAGVYLALMGPQGMHEIGEGIMTRTRYAMEELSQIDGIELPFLNSFHFLEFVVNFDKTGKSVPEINRSLLDKKIFGGKDISREFPDLGQSALFCVTEVHNQESIDSLVTALKEIVES